MFFFLSECFRKRVNWKVLSALSDNERKPKLGKISVLRKRGAGDLTVSRSPREMSWGFQNRGKPVVRHLLVGLVVSIVSYGLLWFNLTDLVARGLVGVLSIAQVRVIGQFGQQTPSLFVHLADGSTLNLAMTQQRVGLVTIAVFGLLFLFLLFPLQGSLWRKLALLELGFVIGLGWNFLRLSLTVLAAYNFGTSAFKITEFVTTPFLDFFWVVAIWSLGLSTMVSKNELELKE